MTTISELTIASKDVENPEYTQVLTMISETGKAPRVVIYANNNEDNLLKKCQETHNIELISMLQTFFALAYEDKLYIKESDKDYFYQSLAEAIFYYVDSEYFCNHFAYNEIKLTDLRVVKKL